MDQILNNPGLQHLAENVFWNLDVEVLEICAQINQTTKNILEDSFFWLKKFRGLSNEDQNDWIKSIPSIKNAGNEKAFITYMKWHLKNKVKLPTRHFTIEQSRLFSFLCVLCYDDVY